MTRDDSAMECWEHLLKVLDEHQDWFHQFIQHVFYMHDVPISEMVPKPASFAAWVVHSNRHSRIEPETIEKLSALHIDLFKKADFIVHNARDTGDVPSRKNFQKFVLAYEQFAQHSHRLEKEILMEGTGYDPFTGLRSHGMFENDIQQELHRLARKGRTFCIALIHIDHFDDIKKYAHNNDVGGYVKLLAGLIKLSIRSFDDAYYTRENEFALCLKQADISGGISALERLRKELEEQNVLFKNEHGVDVPLSVSCCVAEPVVTDDVSVLLHNLRNDLSRGDYRKGDSVLQYHELSPLQRYVEEGG